MELHAPSMSLFSFPKDCWGGKERKEEEKKKKEREKKKKKRKKEKKKKKNKKEGGLEGWVLALVFAWCRCWVLQYLLLGC